MRHIAFLVVFALAGLPMAPARAQGTAAQREACTPDAIKLCSDTIPDVAKTKDCLTAHAADLSAACRAVVIAAAPVPTPTKSVAVPPPARRDRHARVRLPADPDAEIRYVPPRRVIEPSVYGEPGPVIFPKAPYADGSFCSPPYDFCEPTYVDPNDAE